jgi:trimethylamine--corrinoid protein Co-methyltransferase
MSEAANEQRRRGGREARRALRTTPDRQAKGPVQGGLEGGRYRPLSEGEVTRIHGAVLDVLEQIGFADPIPSCVELLTAAGCHLSAEGRLLFPRALVEDTIAKAARRFALHGQEPRHDMEPWGTSVYFGTAGAAVQTVEATSGAYRDSTLKDLYDAARMVDALEHIHYFQRTVVPCDMASPFDLDFNTCYASVSGTAKHVGTSWVEPEHLESSIEMLHLIAGGEATWRRRPFVSMSCCFVVPPLKFAEDACRCLELGVREGMPILLLSAAQAGATGPAALAGSVVQVMAEVLAGLVYVNAVRPGAPAMLGPWAFVSDLVGLRPDGQPLRPHRRGMRRHDRFQAARRPVGAREGLQPHPGGQRRRQPDLRGGGHARQPARLLPREPGDR